MPARSNRKKTMLYICICTSFSHFYHVILYLYETLWVAVRECLRDPIIENFIKQTHYQISDWESHIHVVKYISIKSNSL